MAKAGNAVLMLPDEGEVAKRADDFSRALLSFQAQRVHADHSAAQPSDAPPSQFKEREAQRSLVHLQQLLADRPSACKHADRIRAENFFNSLLVKDQATNEHLAAMMRDSATSSEMFALIHKAVQVGRLKPSSGVLVALARQLKLEGCPAVVEAMRRHAELADVTIGDSDQADGEDQSLEVQRLAHLRSALSGAAQQGSSDASVSGAREFFGALVENGVVTLEHVGVMLEACKSSAEVGEILTVAKLLQDHSVHDCSALLKRLTCATDPSSSHAMQAGARLAAKQLFEFLFSRKACTVQDLSYFLRTCTCSAEVQSWLERARVDVGLEPDEEAYSMLIRELELEGDGISLSRAYLRAQSAGWSKSVRRSPDEAAQRALDLRAGRKDRLRALLVLHRTYGYGHALSMATNFIATLSHNGVLDVELLRIALGACKSSTDVKTLLPFAEKAGAECASAVDDALVRRLVLEGASVAEAHLQRLGARVAPNVAVAPADNHVPLLVEEDTSLFRQRLLRLLSCVVHPVDAHAHTGHEHLILAEIPSFGTAIGNESERLRAILPRLLPEPDPALAPSAMELLDAMLAARLTGSAPQMEFQMQTAQRSGIKPGLRSYARFLHHLRLEGHKANFERVVAHLAGTQIGSDPAIVALVDQKEVEFEALRAVHISGILSAEKDTRAFQQAAEFVATLIRNGVATESHVCDVLECFQGLSSRMLRLVDEFARQSAKPPGTRMLGILARQLQIDGDVDRFNSVLAHLQRDDTDHDRLAAALIKADSLSEARTSLLARLISLERAQRILAGAAHAQYEVMLAAGVVDSKILLVMMKSCVDSQSMIALLERTRPVVKPDIDHYNIALRQLRVEADAAGTRQLLQSMKAELVLPNAETRNIFDLAPGDLRQLRSEFLSMLAEQSGFTEAFGAFRRIIPTKDPDPLVVRRMLQLCSNGDNIRLVLEEVKSNGLTVSVDAYAPVIRQLRVEGDQQALKSVLEAIQPAGLAVQDSDCIAALAMTPEEVDSVRWKLFATLPPRKARLLYATLIKHGVARPEYLAAALRRCDNFAQMVALLQSAQQTMGIPLDVPCFATLLERAAHEGGSALETIRELGMELDADASPALKELRG